MQRVCATSLYPKIVFHMSSVSVLQCSNPHSVQPNMALGKSNILLNLLLISSLCKSNVQLYFSVRELYLSHTGQDFGSGGLHFVQTDTSVKSRGAAGQIKYSEVLVWRGDEHPKSIDLSTSFIYPFTPLFIYLFTSDFKGHYQRTRRI